jgi:hypothetical protein
MATIIGRNASVAVSDTIGGTYVPIGKVTSASMSFASDMADETNNDSGGFKEEQPADSQATVEISGRWDVGDAGQREIAARAVSKELKYYRFRPKTGAGEHQYIFGAHVSDFSVDTETGAVEDFSATLVSTGTVTKSTQ